jgi:lysozyme family protein
MTKATTDAVLDRVLSEEGGLSDHASDRGGLTHFGLTRGFLETVTGRKWTDDEITALTLATARSVYTLWIQMKRLDTLPDDVELAFTVIDYAVNSGERAAIKAVQRSLGLVVDGILGPDTQRELAMLDVLERKRLRRYVLAARLEHIGLIVKATPSQSAFIHGWLKRVAAQVRA